MRRALLAGATLAMLSACGSQSDQPAAPEQATETAAATPAAATPSETPATAASPSSAAGDFAKGDTVEVTVQTKCREVGPDADETPWDVYPGVTKEVLAVDGDQLRVTIGDTECLLPASAVKRS